MKLQVLIPHYKVSEKIIGNLLDSIKFQKRVNFKDIEVCIMTDGDDYYLNQDFIESFPFKINYYKEEHQGISATRNRLLDKATADYVMFCDQDDCFCNNFGLYLMLQFLSDNTADALVCPFYEERFNGKNYFYQLMGDKEKEGLQGTCIHGKAYRREYLIKNNIRFQSCLDGLEDSYFNAIVLNCAKKIKYCPIPYYVWCFNASSVTRAQQFWEIKTYPKLIEGNSLLVDYFLERNMLTCAYVYVNQMIYNAYMTLEFPPYPNQKEVRKYLANDFRAMHNYLDKYYKYFNLLDVNSKNKIETMQIKYAQLHFNTSSEPKFDIEKWIQKIREQY